MKQTGMLVVSLRGVNFGFWSRLGCSGQSANILCRQGLVQGSAKKDRITRRETEVKFSFKFSFQIKAFDNYVFISLKLIACRNCEFLSRLFQGSKLVSFRGHKKLEPRPDGLLQGLNSKFPTSIPVSSLWEYPPGVCVKRPTVKRHQQI